MTVRELISALESYDPDTIVCTADDDSRYAYAIENVLENHGVRTYFGSDYPAIFLCGRQDGAVWELGELELPR